MSTVPDYGIELRPLPLRRRIRSIAAVAALVVGALVIIGLNAFNGSPPPAAVAPPGAAASPVTVPATTQNGELSAAR